MPLKVSDGDNPSLSKLLSGFPFVKKSGSSVALKEKPKLQSLLPSDTGSFFRYVFLLLDAPEVPIFGNILPACGEPDRSLHNVPSCCYCFFSSWDKAYHSLLECNFRVCTVGIHLELNWLLKCTFSVPVFLLTAGLWTEFVLVVLAGTTAL